MLSSQKLLLLTRDYSPLFKGRLVGFPKAVSLSDLPLPYIKKQLASELAEAVAVIQLLF
jgi:hypothetical protein